jgi:hypothetical protein
MGDFYKPNWLYESLPYLYIAAGVLTVTSLEHPAALFSSFLLFMSGILVWHMRRTNRRKIKFPIDLHRYSSFKSQSRR